MNQSKNGDTESPRSTVQLSYEKHNYIRSVSQKLERSDEHRHKQLVLPSNHSDSFSASNSKGSMHSSRSASPKEAESLDKASEIGNHTPRKKQSNSEQ